MELDELQRRILHRQELERLESIPPKSYNPSEGMSPEEMSRYIQFLFNQLEEIKEELRRANTTIAENASVSTQLLFSL